MICVQLSKINFKNVNSWKRTHSLMNKSTTMINRSCFTESCQTLRLRTIMIPGRAKATIKLAKDRVTLLFCVNKTGTHKLQPLCIGKYAKPRCFSHVNMNTLSLAYPKSCNVWITAKIFQEWFDTTFVPAVRRHMR